MKRFVIPMFFACGCGAPDVGLEPPELPIEVIAHRGASGSAPENTMAAFRRAFEVGVHRIELDVQLSRDGRVVVIHDTTLDRTTDGSGPVSEHDWAELAELDAGSWLSAEYAGEPIPLLGDVLQWSADRIPLNIEIKIRGGGEPALALTRATMELVAHHEVEATVLFSSFDAVAAAEAVRLCPSCEVALLWNGISPLDPLPQVEEIGAESLHLPLDAATVELVGAARDRDLAVRVYTVNDAAQLDRALDLGVDAVFTDEPELVLELLAAQPTESD